MSTREIAGVLEIAENTVRSRLSRARDKLRAVLAELGSPDEAQAGRVRARRLASRGVNEWLRGFELRGDAEQQILAAVRGDELHADRQAGARFGRAGSSTRAGRSR